MVRWLFKIVLSSSLLVFVITLVSCGGGGSGSPSSSSGLSLLSAPTIEEEKHPQSIKGSFYYLRIVEENKDELSTLRSTSEVERSTPPFWVNREDKHIYVKKTVIDNIEDDTVKQTHQLQTFPAQLDSFSKATLLIEYQVSFKGQGRDLNVPRYYVFRDLPAILSLGAASYEGEDVILSPLDNKKSTDVRFLPSEIKIIKKPDGLYFSDTTALKLGETPRPRIYHSSKTLFVKTQTLSIPKGVELTKELFQPQEVSLGEINFSTSLYLEYEGFYEEIMAF